MERLLQDAFRLGPFFAAAAGTLPFLCLRCQDTQNNVWGFVLVAADSISGT